MSAGGRRPRVFMMDLLATVPYYTAYLSKALLREPVDLTVGTITYYLDPDCFSSRGIKIDPGLLDVVGKVRLARLPRRILKLLEAMLNLCALTVRFSVSPPDVVHVQYLPMLRTPAAMDLWFVEFCRWRGSKIVLTVHDLLPHDTGDEHRATYDKLYRGMDAIVCHSDSVRARLATEFAVSGGKNNGDCAWAVLLRPSRDGRRRDAARICAGAGQGDGVVAGDHLPLQGDRYFAARVAAGGGDARRCLPGDCRHGRAGAVAGDSRAGGGAGPEAGEAGTSALSAAKSWWRCIARRTWWCIPTAR